MKKLLYLAAVLAALSMLFAGCEIEGDGDADAVTSNDTGTSTNEDTGTPDSTTTYKEYRYVRIDDISGNADDIDGGADIDAIILFKAGGSAVYADNVEAFEHGGGFGTEVDSTEALGQPDAFENYSGVGVGIDRCHVDTGYVSLGGTDGLLIVHMADQIEVGDSLSVLEVGGCEFWDDEDHEAIEDDVRVSVSVGKSLTDQWQVLGEGAGPEINFDLTATDLPNVELD